MEQIANALATQIELNLRMNIAVNFAIGFGFRPLLTSIGSQFLPGRLMSNGKI